MLVNLIATTGMEHLKTVTTNYSVNQSIIPDTMANDGEFLFTTLHNYHVTLESFIVAIVMIMIGIWIIILNCLLIHTLIKYHAQLEVTDMFIHSLAVTDALIGVLVLYNSTYNIINFQNRYECLVRFGVIHAMLLNSTGHISLLTINRYIKISKTFKYQKIFKKWLILTLSGSVWLISFVIGLSPLVGWNKEYQPPIEDESHVACRYFGIMTPGFIILNVSIYWILLILMLTLYLCIGKITCRHSREILAQQQATGISPKLFDRQSWRLTKTILIVIGVYFFCWLPSGIYFMIELSGSINYLNYTKQGNILTFMTGMGFLNSLFNPIIYATKIPCVKRQFKKLFCCKNSRRQSLHSVAFTRDDTLTAKSQQWQHRKRNSQSYTSQQINLGFQKD